MGGFVGLVLGFDCVLWLLWGALVRLPLVLDVGFWVLVWLAGILIFWV